MRSCVYCLCGGTVFGSEESLVCPPLLRSTSPQAGDIILAAISLCVSIAAIQFRKSLTYFTPSTLSPTLPACYSNR